MDTENIIKELKKHLSFKTDRELAKFLEIEPNVLSNWKKRGTIDEKLIITKCDFIDSDWLLKGGIGQMKLKIGKQVDNNTKRAKDLADIESLRVNENGFIYTKNPDGIPALPIRVQGGFSLHYNDPIFWQELERIYIPGLPFKGDKYLWAEMEGDSMEYYDEDTGRVVGIQDRQWCLYELVPKEFWRKGIKKYYVHLVITDTLFTVKRILQDNEEEIILSPDNELYDQERIHLSNVQGLYVFKRKLDWNASPPRRHEIKV